MNLTVTVKFRRNEPKRYIFANFDPINKLILVQNHGIIQQIAMTFCKILLTVKQIFLPKKKTFSRKKICQLSKSGSRLAIKLERVLFEKTKVDVRVLNDSTLRFKSQVLKHGKLLHSKDEKKRIEFETHSMACYYDFKPFLEQYDAARRVRLGI